MPIMGKLTKKFKIKSFSGLLPIVPIIAIVLAVILGFSLLFFRFVMPFYSNKNPQNIENNFDRNNNSSNKLKDMKDLVKHKTLNLKINGLEQVINILETNIGTNGIKVRPVLSHDSVYGFELLSEMAARYNAYAAINAGFFYEYGEPSGMVLIDGEIITGSTGKYPVLVIKDGEAELRELATELWLRSEAGEPESKTASLKLDSLNVEAKIGKWVLYTRRYGTDNRVKKRNVTMVIEDNIIKKIIVSDKETEIPKNGMLATFIEPSATSATDNPSNSSSLPQNSSEIAPFSEGEKVKFEYKPFLGSNGQAYECGSWIIKDGKIVIGENDPWIGVLTNRDPRTAVGIKETGEVVLITVDGRQPGYSYGLTAQELGECLIQYGIRDAAMLDGGASTEMIIEGKIVNKPSFRSSERPLAGAIIMEEQ